MALVFAIMHLYKNGFCPFFCDFFVCMCVCVFVVVVFSSDGMVDPTNIYAFAYDSV